MIFDVEHSCTDTREEQKQNNGLSALPWVGGMMGGGGGKKSYCIACQLSCCSSFIWKHVLFQKREGKKKKKEFSHDISLFALVSGTEKDYSLSVRDTCCKTCLQPVTSSYQMTTPLPPVAEAACLTILQFPAAGESCCPVPTTAWLYSWKLISQ